MDELLTIVTKTLDEKLASEICTIDMRQSSPFTDYFVIATANSLRQASALKDYVVDAIEQQGFSTKGIEGDDTSWVLVDLGSIVVHIFTQDARRQYRLEELWGDLPMTYLHQEENHAL